MKKNIQKLLMLIVLILISGNVYAYNNDYLYKNEDFYYENIHYDIEIYEKGIIKITQRRIVHYNKPLHGIIVNLGERVNYNDNNNKITLINNVYDFNMISEHNYKTTRDHDTLRVKIGSPNYYANMEEEYIFNYKVLIKDINKSYELLNFKFKDGDTNSIKKLTFKITSYKDTDFTKMKFYKGIHSTLEFKNIRLNFTSNSIEGEVREPILNNESFSCNMMFEKGYFNYIKKKDNFLNVLFIIIALFSSIIFYLIYYFIGKDKNLISPITMSIPNDITSLDVSYIYNGYIDSTSIMSLLFELANKKYIKIEAHKNKFLVSKIKDYDGDDKSVKELLSCLFHDGLKIVNLKTKNKKFGENLYNTFKKIKKYTKTKFLKDKKLYNNNIISILIFTLIISIVQILYLVFCFFSIMEYFGGINDEENIMIVTCLMIFNFLIGILANKFYSNVNNKYKIVLGSFITFIYFILYLITINHIQKGVIPLTFLDVLFSLICYFNIFLIQFLSKRTEYGNKISGEVKGLHTFIKYTKEDKIKMLLDDNPKLFFDILPVAFAFGLTKKWLEVFKELDYKYSDIDNFDYLYSLDTLFSIADFNNEGINYISSYGEYVSEISDSGFSGSSDSGFGDGGDSGW